MRMIHAAYVVLDHPDPTEENPKVDVVQVGRVADLSRFTVLQI